MVRAQRDIACAVPDPDVVFGVLAESVLTVFPAEGAIASQPEGDVIVARACAGVAGPDVGHRLPLAGTLGGRALRTGEGQLCRDSEPFIICISSSPTASSRVPPMVAALNENELS